ncbi:hypothetical protein COY05_02865 [Candidatus Peregrinibacteria bacterium CG_4_10_14_0_2_um_filter_38_24]|nr:MAG: hypothetical protein COY05_02865 [Candidatus Peregrinibacteria bacterium CG_4_10_14_0_2_um_filter_38_24]
MPENEPNQEAISVLEKGLKKYKILFFSVVGALVVGVLLFTNYNMGSKLTGFIGPSFGGDPQAYCKQYPNDPSCKEILPNPEPKTTISAITSPKTNDVITLAEGDSSLKFAWSVSVPTDATYKVIQFNAAQLPTFSYEWQIKERGANGAVKWEVTKAGSEGGSVAAENTICNVQLYDAMQNALDSGLDWICPYVTIPSSKLTKDTEYTFSVRVYDGKNFSDYKLVSFKTKEQNTPTKCTEGQKTSDNTLICTAGKWEVNAVPPEDESVPSLTAKSGQTMTAEADATTEDESVPSLTPIKAQADGQAADGATTDLKLTKADISSKTFNPLVNSTKFIIETSADAKVDIKIYDKANKLVVSPISNKDVNGNKEYTVYWEGNDDAKKTLPAGTYSYKIIAKDPTTKKDADTKTGEVILKYGSTAKDFENINGKTSGSNSVNPADTTKSVTDQSASAKNAQSSSNDQATVALQNSKEGKTAGTGPETIIYLIFPILGYTMRRKFK